MAGPPSRAPALPRAALAALWLLAALPAAAEEFALVATRAIRSGSTIGPADVTLAPAAQPGALADPGLVVGLEARVTLYPGRPILEGQVGPPALVFRNATVTLLYAAPGLHIAAEGRALDRGGLGDRVRVMNLASRLIVTGRVAAPGIVEVGP